MSIRIRICQAFVVTGVALMVSTGVFADAKTKYVVEHFTSQGCYSCPPADKLLGMLVENNEEVLGLEFHVDYWDSLVYGSAGKWKDPFSSPAYSQRQRDYNRLSLKGRTGVYTPQMVVNGNYAFVGSKAEQAKKQLDKDSSLILETSAEISSDGNITINIDGQYHSKADVWLITYDKKNVTVIDTGENKGKTLTNYNVVREFEFVGKWKGDPVAITTTLKSLDENQNCAVIVQRYDSTRQSVAGPIVGAAICKHS
jgi:hypothetical protein